MKIFLSQFKSEIKVPWLGLYIPGFKFAKKKKKKKKKIVSVRAGEAIIGIAYFSSFFM